MIQKRAAVLQVLRESEGHLQAEEIFRRVKEKYPGIVLATVYNNLHALCEAGLIRHIPTMEGADFYDKTVGPHEHAICSVCGKLMDADMADFGEVLRRHTKLPILHYDLILHTICPDCDKQ